MATRSQVAERLDLKGFLDELEEAIEAVRHAYEKYFSGVDRIPPVRQRERLERRLRKLAGMGLRSTALRFRAGGLRARFVTYKHYWTRVEHELERGASRRDMIRLRRGAPAPPAKAAEAESPAAEAGERFEPPPSAAASEDPRPAAGPPPLAPGQGGILPPPPPAGPGRASGPAAAIDPGHLRDVFKQLVKAKRAAGESTDGLTFAALVRKLSREAPKLKKKHKCSDLRFEVSTEGGKVRLRSRPGRLPSRPG